MLMTVDMSRVATKAPRPISRSGARSCKIGSRQIKDRRPESGLSARMVEVMRGGRGRGVTVAAQAQGTLRRRNVVAGDEPLRIAVRARPVLITGLGWVATHCFLVLLESGRIVDSLSFDPNNSDGVHDAQPRTYTRGELELGTDIGGDNWGSLRAWFVRNQENGEPYNIGTNNCCHAVMRAISAAALPRGDDGIKFAYNANQTWQRIWRNIGPRESAKKEV